MAFTNWAAVAAAVAEYARQYLFTIPRGAALIRFMSERTAVVAAFGNDSYSTDERAWREAELVRQWLREDSVDELGFGLSEDGSTWALVAKADSRCFQPSVGKEFRPKVLAAYLDHSVRAAWRIASGIV